MQELQIGDEVQTLAGRKTIKWIGYNKFTKEEGRAWQDSIMPIRVARFAIDDHTPHCDLYLSPLHCIFFNEALIPVMYLINEASIAQGMPPDVSAIEYYHIDLDTHDVIYAEGALVESFFDDGSNRENFSNFVQYERLYGVERQVRDDTIRTNSQIPWSAPGVEGPCKVSNFQRCRRPRSDPNCLRPACQASGSDAGLTVVPADESGEMAGARLSRVTPRTNRL